MKIRKIEGDLLTNKYTTVLSEKEGEMEFGAPHHFKVYADIGQKVPYQVGEVNFQKGAIKEHGVNGVCNEDLIAMVIDRLEYFQKGEYRCRENAVAITKLEETLMWLGKRTAGRAKRNVEGTSEV